MSEVETGIGRMKVDIEEEAQNVPDLGERRSANVTSHGFDPIDGNRPDVLTLCGGVSREAIVLIRLDLHLGAKRPNDRSQWNDLHDIGRLIKDFLGSNHHNGPPQTRLPTSLRSEIEVDHVTRGQHRASSSPPRSMEPANHGPSAADAVFERR